MKKILLTVVIFVLGLTVNLKAQEDTSKMSKCHPKCHPKEKQTNPCHPKEKTKETCTPMKKGTSNPKDGMCKPKTPCTPKKEKTSCTPKK